MQFNKNQKTRDFQSQSPSQSDSTQLQNHSIIINCYQQKKVSLLTQQTLLTDKSFYINFNVQQLSNHKIYIMYITSYRIYLMCTVDSQIVTIPHAYIKDYTCFDNQIRFNVKTGLKYFLLPVDAQQTTEIFQNLKLGQTHIPFSLFVKFNDQQPEVYDCLAQMQRMLINWKKVIAIDNKNGKEIQTYPKIVFIPTRIDKQVVKQNQKSRFNSRIPALTYYSQQNDVSLWRCGHTLKQQSNKYDFSYLQAISPSLLIIEIQQIENRRQSIYSFNHFSNQIKYSIYKFQNLFQVKCNYEKVIMAYLKDDMSVFWKVISKWYEQIDVLIKCAWKAVEQMKNKRPILVQENDYSKTQTTSTQFSKGGIDRACQICSLIQVIIDPYYRSMKGLSVLIQKQFMSFGYPFKDRCGFQQQQSSSSPRKVSQQTTLSMMSSIYRQKQRQPKRTQISQTFIQFLQCLSQLINCFPSHFQYSSQYLAQIGYQLYSGKFNNFLFNTFHQKQLFPDIKNTQSLYQHIGSQKRFWNFQFSYSNERNLVKIRSMPSIKEYLVWKQYWNMVTKMNCAQRKTQQTLQTAIFRKLVKQKKDQLLKNS